MVRRFNTMSTEHFGVKKGDKFKTIKHHHEVHGDLEEGSIVVLEGISHFPTMYKVLDLETSRTFTVPVHTVKKMP